MLPFLVAGCALTQTGKEPRFKGKYHANLLSFQNPKMFVCQQKQKYNCLVFSSAITLSISASGQRQSRPVSIET